MSKVKPFRAEIPEAFDSLNVVQRLHWTARRALGEKWTLLLMEQRAHLYPKAKRKTFLRITRSSPGTLDLDNLWGGAKIVVDAIKRLGLIVDDSPRWCVLNVVQVIGPAGTRIEIREAKR